MTELMTRERIERVARFSALGHEEYDAEVRDLARTALSLMDRLADADMAQAMLVAEAYALGFEASGEGWNGEYPTMDFRKDAYWLERRDRDLAALAPYAGVKGLTQAQADLDRLTADNANLRARIEKLRGAMNTAGNSLDFAADKMAGHYAPSYILDVRKAALDVSNALAEDDMLVSALATREAWKQVLPGGEG